MRACYITEYGSPDVIQVGNLPDPEPGKWEVLIETHASALNHLDIWVRMGRPGNSLSFPHIFGSDTAGIVRAVGDDVHGINIGDEVIINPGINCGCCRFCRSGEHSECIHYGIVGLSRPGTFAQLVTVPAECVFRKPEHLSFEEASAFPLTFLTAWRMLITKGSLSPGETILIHGIGGGVAQAALAIAILCSAEIIVTSSSEAKIEKAKKMGAHHGILYTRENVVEKVLDLTHKQGVDLVVDTVGAKSVQVSIQCARRGGKIVLCGVTTGATGTINLQAIYWNQIKIFGSTMGSQAEFRQMLDAVNSNKLKPVIDTVYPLDSIRQATERMERGEQIGKIVLKTI